jgi:hypothetical protein
MLPLCQSSQDSYSVIKKIGIITSLCRRGNWGKQACKESKARTQIMTAVMHRARPSMCGKYSHAGGKQQQRGYTGNVSTPPRHSTQMTQINDTSRSINQRLVIGKESCGIVGDDWNHRRRGPKTSIEEQHHQPNC